MQRGYRGVAGSPVRPYVQTTINAGSDCWLNLTFIDSTGALATPSTLSYRIDNLTTDTLIQQDTPLTPTGSSYSLNLPGSLNIINNDIGQSSQLNQVLVTAVFADGSTQRQVFIYEIIALQTVGG